MAAKKYMRFRTEDLSFSIRLPPPGLGCGNCTCPPLTCQNTTVCRPITVIPTDGERAAVIAMLERAIELVKKS